MTDLIYAKNALEWANCNQVKVINLQSGFSQHTPKLNNN